MPKSDVIPSLETDPCGRARALRAAKDLVITGTGVAEYDAEQGNGVRRRVKYTTASLGHLDKEIAAAETACALKRGKRPRRFAVTPRGGGW